MIPVDKKRCQAEKPNGNTFMTLGGSPGLIRCSTRPIIIATERKSGKDGKKGSMSLCSSCVEQMKKQLPNFATFKAISKRKP